MINRIQRTAIGISAVTVLSLGLIASATATHGPNCDQPREDVVAFLQDNMDEWNVYDRDDDGVACEETHQLTQADITGGDDNDDADDSDEGDDDADSDDSDGDDEITVPTEVDTGR